jgi:hypothetical protein
MVTLYQVNLSPIFGNPKINRTEQNRTERKITLCDIMRKQ